MTWFTILFLQVLLATFAESQLNLECPAGYEIKDSYCYKKVYATFPWEKAEDACEREGSRLVWIDDWHENDYVQKLFSSSSEKMYWTGLKKTGNEWKWTGNSETYNLYYGFWEAMQPDISSTAECVAGMVNGDWMLVPCQKMLPFICKTTAFPPGSFKCSKGPAISSMHKCDGYNDCEDGSDEVQCDSGSYCNWYSSASSGTKLIFYRTSKTCLFTLKANIGERIKVMLSSPLTTVEDHADSLKVYTGGLTLSESYLIGNVKGSLSPGQTFISGNNYMILRMTTDQSREGQVITMTWTNVVQEIFNSPQSLTARSSYIQLSSPFYPSMLPPDLAMAWDITAATFGQVITVKFEEVSLDSGSSLKLYDRDMTNAVLSDVRSVPKPAMYISYSSTIRIQLSSSAAYQSSTSGFRLLYKEGCADTFNPASSGTISTPGFLTGAYPRGVTCTWNIIAPALRRLTLRKISFDLHGNADYMKVYNSSNSPFHTGSGYTGLINSPIVLQSDNLKIEFLSDRVRSGTGFELKYSVDCERWTPSKGTVISETTGPFPSFESSIVVTCEEGYSFMQEEYNLMTAVHMLCEAGGKWNVSRIPECLITYCPIPPKVSNGWIDAAYGGVRVGGNVSYVCEDGFVLSNSAPIKCKTDGTWENPPSCTSINCNTLPFVNNGKRRNLTATLNQYGDVIEYDCNEGYETVGYTFAYCQTNGTWSHDVPTCQAITCPLVPVMHAEWSTMNGVSFGNTGSLTCSSGFKWNVTNSPSISVTCLADGTFSNMEGCIDVDECADNLDNCTQLEDCDNTVGGFKCTCKNGYFRNSTSSLCQDVLECSVNNGGCSDTCNEEVPGYSCSCPAGHELYTEINQNNISISSVETGLREGDEIYINHTCVRKTCDSLSHPSNGQRLTEDAYTFYYEDTVYFACDIGYTMSGSKNITCEANQQWSGSVPTCTRASCLVPPHEARMLNSSIVPGGMAYLSDAVTFQCQYGSQVLERTMYCGYLGNEQYGWQGDNYSCPEINCGDPEVVPGSVYEARSGNSWKDTFTFGCETGFDDSGVSTTNNSVVMCEENGRWGLGNLTCSGTRCIDPGTPIDAQQISTSYEVGQEVYWTCERLGFSPDPPTVIKCEISGNAVAWNSSVRPTCKDKEDPKFNSCPTEAIYLQKSTAVNYVVPTATDNTGVLQSFSVQPDNMEPGSTINQNTTIVYTAKDYAGNTATCEINVIVIEGSAPLLSCLNTSVHYINTSAGYSINPLSDIPGLTLPTLPGVTYAASPPFVTVNFASLNSLQKVTITASYRNLLSSSCSFLITTEASGCLIDSLQPVERSGRSCAANTFSCSIPCVSGYVHYNTGLNTKHYNCTGANIWNPPLNREPCINPMTSQFTITINATFKLQQSASSCMDAFKFSVHPLLLQAMQAEQNSCVQTSFTVSQTIDSTVTDTNSISSIMTITLAPNTVGAFKGICSNSINALIQTSVISPLSKASSSIGCTTGTSTVVPIYTKSGVMNSGNACLTPGYVLRQKDQDEECVPTLPGTFEASDVSVSCPDGMYQDLSGQTSCKDCGSGTMPDASKEKCIETCPRGFISDNGFPPCRPCDKDYYWGNSTHCVPCLPNTSTVEQNGMGYDTDCKAECQPGWFSATGYEPCMQCPSNFYQALTGQKECLECNTSATTANQGSNSSNLCVDAASTLCTSTTCGGNGVCSVKNHKAFCECNPGYYGDNCENMNNFCSASPCLEGSCYNIQGTGYNCTCNSGYTGNNCEMDLTPQCSNNQCKAGSCKSLRNDYECLCPVTGGYTKPLCQRVEDLCAGIPCLNGATCVAYGSVRKHCICRPGYTGDDCGTNINECTENPLGCMYNGTCVDEVNGYRCQCRAGFSNSNDNCHNLNNFCDTDPCFNAECYNDYDNYRSVCMCHDGYHLDNGKCIRTDPCQDVKCNTTNSVCSDGKCLCVQGFTGEYCQHDKIDCTESTCGNGGTCVDLTSDVKCLCMSGYTGDRCQTNIDDCVGQCTGEHVVVSNRCTDKVNDYMCNCEGGWKGQNCTENIDECASYPCQHGANCTDGDNTYTCDCLTGWTGQDCSTPVNFCQNKPCQNEGTCYNMNNGFFCSCLGGTTGDTCSTFPPVCNVIQPCTAQGSCADVEGTAKCNCLSDDYTGSSCQLKTYHCGKSPCGNDGTCITDSGTGFTCNCKNSFYGTTCGQYTDPCSPNPCTTGAVCRSDEEHYSCACPGGAVMTETQCKSSSVIGDMLVDAAVDSRGTYLNNPFMFYDADMFSIMLWVLCSNETYSSPMIMALEPRDIGDTGPGWMESPPTEKYLVKMTNEGVLFDNGTQSHMVDFDKNICDKQWHHISLTYHRNSTTFVKLDTTTKANNEMTVSGISASLFQVLLGRKFHGRLSQVMIWNTILTLNDQLLAFETVSNIPSFNKIVQKWMNYAQTKGVTFTSMTAAPNSVCDKGLQDESCVMADKKPPTVVRCPDSVKQLPGPNERIVNIPNLKNSFEFADYVNTYSSVVDGESYLRGRYIIAAYAIDEKQNFAECRFPIYIQYAACPQPSIQGGSLGTCTVGSESKTCSANCPSGSDISRPIPKIFHCTNLGVYNPAEPYSPFILPSCATASESVSRQVAVELIYDLVNTCSRVDLNAFESQLRSNLKNSGICGSGCTISTNLRCETSSGKVLLVGFNLSGLEKTIPVSFTGGASEGYQPSEAVTFVVYNTNAMNFQSVVGGAVLRLNEENISILESVSCPDGSQVIGTQCVQCSQGQYYDSDSKTCKQCAWNTYQDQAGMSTCKPCNGNKITLTQGAFDSSFCVDNCTAGNFYNESSSSCAPCGKDFYQEHYGRNYCDFCPLDKITTGTGSDSPDDCNDDCPVGYERIQSNQNCVECPKGTFRIQLAEKCIPCDEGFTTEGVATPDASGCSVRICYNGTFRNASNHCEDCPYGYYQDEDFKDECKKCPDSESTMYMGSNHSSQCIFFCKAGEEAVTGQKLCTPCNRSYYHTGEHPDIFNPCQQCPTNKTTEMTGSTNMDNCTIVICDKGQEVNSSGDGCVDCPYNTFQDVYMPNSYQKCTECGTSRATKNMKSTSYTDCLLYCPTAGTYDSGSGNCKTCPRGTYRSVDDHSTAFSPCMNCSSGWTTEGEGNIGEFNCSIEICPKGKELNSSGHCVTCPYDTYQDVDIPTSMDRCKSCMSNEATDNMGSTDKSDCKPYCTQAGTEFNDQGTTCVPCPRGMYRSIDDRTKYFTSCLNCTGRTTEGDGSISSSNCSIDKCQAGEVVTSSGNCAACPKDTYQPMMYPNSAVKCINCSSTKATLEGGQTSKASCVRVCSAGQQYNNDTDQCEPCVKGTWNNGNDTMKFQQCESCPVNYTTVAGGNTDIANCTLLDCAPGSYISGQDCLLCGIGSYQSNRHQSSCIKCGPNQNTTNFGSSQESDCQIFCSPGLAGVPDPNSPTGDKKCAKCPADTIKEQPGLDNCISCEVKAPNFTANDARTACNQIYCDKGFRYNASATTDKCIPCEQGTYKSARGRITTCDACNPGWTTSGIAATNSTDCDQLHCVVGKYYDATSNSCVPCVVGTYKNTVGNTNCTACNTGFTTPITGATSDTQCNIVVCPAGQKRDTVTNTCQKCAYGEYQPNSGATSCNTCSPASYSTQSTGTILESDCIPTCSPGYEYNTTSRMCDACRLGTYKVLNGNWQNDRTTVINCTACNPDKTTTSVASTSPSACSLDLCQPGKFQQNGACELCPKGSYQDLVGQTSCKSCGTGETTKVFSGAQAESECIPDCPPGKEHDYTNSSCCCTDCLKGYYVDKAKSEDCIECPSGMTNLSPGSTTCPYTKGEGLVIKLVQVIFSLQMRVTSFDCSNSDSLNIYIANVKIKIVNRMQSLGYNLCIPSSTCANLQGMAITVNSNGGCTPVGGSGRRKRNTDAILNLNVAVQPVPNPATSSTTNGVRRPIDSVVNQMINTNPASITPPGSTLNSGSVSSVTTQCNAGQVLSSNTCEACGAGTYENLGTCVNCPVNQYQDLTGQTTCKQCSATSSVKIYTAGTNSTSVTECVSICAVNSDYCKNGGTCVADQSVYCTCGSRYSGTNCEIRNEPDNSTWIYIVAGTIGGIVFLVIVVIILVVFCRQPSSPKRKTVYEKEETQRTNHGYQSYPDNVGFPYQYPVVPQSMTQTLPETYYLPYQQPYQQPRAIHNGRYRGFEIDDENSSAYKWTSFSER